MKFIIPVIILSLFAIRDVGAQLHQPIFPSLEGSELLDSLVAKFKPQPSLNQAMSRDTLFGIIDNHDDSLTCVYTGFTIWLDPTQDPTQAAFMNGGPDALNTEHTYPQSMGATGVARGDLHHLYATRADVNDARGNLPFGEIEDTGTEDWFYQNQTSTTIPTQNIDLYSEKTADFFEPPEAHKGNVARAMFYFYTMYKEQADMANATFFETQRETLCAWHFLDPVDEAEWNRTFHIAQYQDDKANPFVLDCTLPERTYCAEFEQKCAPVSTGSIIGDFPLHLRQNAPNPFQNQTTIHYELDRSYHVRLAIVNESGHVIEIIKDDWQRAGRYDLIFDNDKIHASGPVFCQLILSDGKIRISNIRKMIILK